jgi:hypothetical protein
LPEPLPEGIDEIACVSCEAAAAIVAVNVSDTDKPLVSVAVTLRLSEEAVDGAVPENVSVVALNFNHDGSAALLACVAV